MVRLDGRVYGWGNRSAPIGPDSVGVSYTDTGYVLGDLRLYRILSSPDGRDGRQILMRQGDSIAGAVYLVEESCS